MHQDMLLVLILSNKITILLFYDLDMWWFQSSPGICCSWNYWWHRQAYGEVHIIYVWYFFRS